MSISSRAGTCASVETDAHEHPARELERHVLHEYGEEFAVDEASVRRLKVKEEVGEILLIPWQAAENVIDGTDCQELKCACFAQGFALEAKEKDENVQEDATGDQDETPTSQNFAQHVHEISHFKKFFYNLVFTAVRKFLFLLKKIFCLNIKEFSIQNYNRFLLIFYRIV